MKFIHVTINTHSYFTNRRQTVIIIIIDYENYNSDDEEFHDLAGFVYLQNKAFGKSYTGIL